MDRQFHNGVDLPAPSGSLVYAVLPGRVAAVYPNGALNRYGNLLVVHHDQPRVTTVYAHLKDPPFFGPGDPIVPGVPIGSVGMTGACGSRRAAGRCTPCGPRGELLCSGPHLHFEVLPGHVTTRLHPGMRRLNPFDFAVENDFKLRPTSPLEPVQYTSADDPDTYQEADEMGDPIPGGPGRAWYTGALWAGLTVAVVSAAFYVMRD